MTHPQKLKLPRLFFGQMRVQKPDSIVICSLFRPGTRLYRNSSFMASFQPSRTPGISDPGYPKSRVWFWNFGVRSSVEPRIFLPPKSDSIAMLGAG